MVGAEGVRYHCFFWGETLEKGQREEEGEVKKHTGFSVFPHRPEWCAALSTVVTVPTLPASQGIYNYPPATSLGGSSVLWVRCQMTDRLLTEALQVFMSGQRSFQAFCPHFQDLWLYFNLLCRGSVPGKAAPQGIQLKHLFLQSVGASVSVGCPPGQANNTSCSSSSRSCALLSNILHLPGVIDRFGNCTDGEWSLLCKYKGGFILQIIPVHCIQLSAMIPLDDFPGMA